MFNVEVCIILGLVQHLDVSLPAADPGGKGRCFVAAGKSANSGIYQWLTVCPYIALIEIIFMSVYTTRQLQNLL